jgi:hypothetical protein
VFELAFDDQGKDFHVLVAMGSKPLGGRDKILVDDEKITESQMFRVVILAKGERMVTVQPTRFGLASFRSPSQFNHAA